MQRQTFKRPIQHTAWMLPHVWLNSVTPPSRRYSVETPNPKALAWPLVTLPWYSTLLFPILPVPLSLKQTTNLNPHSPTKQSTMEKLNFHFAWEEKFWLTSDIHRLSNLSHWLQLLTRPLAVHSRAQPPPMHLKGKPFFLSAAAPANPAWLQFRRPQPLLNLCKTQDNAEYTHVPTISLAYYAALSVRSWSFFVGYRLNGNGNHHRLSHRRQILVLHFTPPCKNTPFSYRHNPYAQMQTCSQVKSLEMLQFCEASNHVPTSVFTDSLSRS